MTDKKDNWDKLQILATALIPVVIAVLGLYFTEAYNKNQLALQAKIAEQQNVLQSRSADRQNEIENTKLQAVQAQMVKDLTLQLSGRDLQARDIALASVVYAAPALGKKIADIIATESPGSAAVVANIYRGKRAELIAGLFSVSVSIRLSAYTEIMSNWGNDEPILSGLIAQAQKAITTNDALIDRNDGIYNVLVVFRGFPVSMLMAHKTDIIRLLHAIPQTNTKILALAKQILYELNS